MLAIIVAVILIGSGAGAAIASAAIEILVTVAVVTTLAIAGVICWVVHTARHDRRARPPGPPRCRQPAPPLRAPERPQVGAGGQHLHLHFDNADPAAVAAILARLSQEDMP